MKALSSLSNLAGLTALPGQTWPQVAPVDEDSSVGLSTWAKELEERFEEETEGTVAAKTTEQMDEDLQPEASPTDVGYFLNVAGRHPLLTADREKELATILWSARRRLVQAFELARRTEAKLESRFPPRSAHHRGYCRRTRVDA